MACRFQISLSADFFDSGVTGGQIEVMSTGAVYHGEDSFCDKVMILYFNMLQSNKISCF
jgi:hypothetical protein